MPSAQTVASLSRAKRTNDEISAARAGSSCDAGDERAVELDQVGREPHDVLEPGVAGAGVVDRDAPAARPHVGERGVEARVVGQQLVLGDLDHESVEALGQHRLDGRRTRAPTG